MKKLVVFAVLFGVVALNCKTTNIYEHARDVRRASQKEKLSSSKDKRPLVSDRELKDIEKKYSKK